MSDEGNNQGHDDGLPSPPDRGGRGQCSLADLMDPHRARGAAGLLARAISAGYIDAFCIDYQEAKKLARELAQLKDNPRAKAAGVKLLAAMAIHDLKLMEIADKSKRLDDGLPTENIGGSIKFIKGVDEEAI